MENSNQRHIKWNFSPFVNFIRLNEKKYLHFLLQIDESHLLFLSVTLMFLSFIFPLTNCLFLLPTDTFIISMDSVVSG